MCTQATVGREPGCASIARAAGLGRLCGPFGRRSARKRANVEPERIKRGACRSRYDLLCRSQARCALPARLRAPTAPGRRALLRDAVRSECLATPRRRTANLLRPRSPRDAGCMRFQRLSSIESSGCHGVRSRRGAAAGAMRPSGFSASFQPRPWLRDAIGELQRLEALAKITYQTRRKAAVWHNANTHSPYFVELFNHRCRRKRVVGRLARCRNPPA